MAFFLIQMETSFATHYKAYYDDVRGKKPLSVIDQRLDNVMKNITVNFERFIIFQGLISGVILIFAQEIAGLFYLGPSQIGIFRIAILGAFLQIASIMILNILFYFDFHKEALLLVVSYFVFNLVFSIGSLFIGLPAYGFGYTLASFMTLLVGVVVLNVRLKHLHYWTFMRQPIFKPKFKFESEGLVGSSRSVISGPSEDFVGRK